MHVGKKLFAQLMDFLLWTTFGRYVARYGATKVYPRSGKLYFASTANFLARFTPTEDRDEVVIDFANAKVKDHSAVEAIDSLAERYRKAGKHLHLRHLSPECLELLTKAKDKVEIDVRTDPLYHIADDKLG